MKCTGRSKVYVKGDDGKRVKGDDGKWLVEVGDDGKPLLKPCASDAMRDQEKCGTHGGRAPQARTAASRRGVEREARGALHRLGVQPVDNPLTALSQLAGEVLAFKDALGEKVNALRELRYEGEGGTEQLRSEVVVFERALDRCATVLGLIAKLRVDERLAAIEETKARAVVAALDAGLAAVGITGPDAVTARQVAARHLRAV